MPSFKFSCPHCGQHYEGDEQRSGMGATCRKCDHFFYIPEVPGKTHMYRRQEGDTSLTNPPPPDAQKPTLKLHKEPPPEPKL